MMKIEMLGGPHDGLEIETENEAFDFPIVERVRMALNPDDAMFMPKMKVHRYRRVSRNRMRYEGVKIR